MPPRHRSRHRSRHRRPGPATAALLALLALPACRDEVPPPARTLRFWWSEPVGTLVPPTVRGIADQEFLRLVYRGLTTNTTDGKVAPSLAESWTSDDGRRWRFRLRPDARFHDGTPVRAEDVIRAWTALAAARDIAPNVPLLEDIVGMDEFTAGRAPVIRGLAAADSLTVDVELVAPRLAFPSVLARPEYVVGGAAGRPDAPVGSGAWRWRSGRPGDSLIVLVRAEPHRGDGDEAVADTLELRVTPATSLADDLAARRLDCVGQVFPGVLTSLTMRPEIAIRTTAPAGVARLAYRGAHPALADVRVRRALALALDLDAIARNTGEGDAVIEGRRLPAVLADGLASRPALPYDPARARSLLLDAGADALTLRIARLPYAVPGDTLRDFVYRIRDYWRAVGVDARVVAPPAFWRALIDGEADVQPQYVLAGFFDGAEFLARLYGSASPTARLAPRLAAHPAIDAAIAVARSERDPRARQRALAAADSLLEGAQPDLLLWHVPLVAARHRDVPSCQVGLFTDAVARGGATR